MEQQSTPAKKANESDHAKRPHRVKKYELCMVLALWMEESPLKQLTDDNSNVAGAVLVLPNERIFAIDCSRNDVHGVANLLTKYPRQAEGCTIFSSRKPCSFCTKLLVQCKVARVFYLPIKPERNEESDIKKVDHLFKVSQVAQSVFVPCIDELVTTEASSKEPTYSQEKLEKDEKDRVVYKNKKKDFLWDANWIKELKVKLPWLAFDGKRMEDQVSTDMENLFNWISIVAVFDPADDVEFKEKSSKEQPEKVESTEMISNSGPDVEDSDWQKLALHLTRMAKIIAQKTDDPKTGVGSVILMENREIVAIGWNGFPSKALYGEFPRASDKDKDVEEDNLKYPYVIHAEQNALLTRNKENIKSESTTMFVTKTPCNECVPLLIEAGVKNVVIPRTRVKNTNAESSGDTDDKRRHLDYSVFEQALKEGKFRRFVSYKTSCGDREKVKQNLFNDSKRKLPAEEKEEEPSKLPKK